MPEQRIIKCPFCKNGNIITMYTPRTMIQRYATAASNKKMMTYYKDEKYSVTTEKCLNCGKSNSEIEKALKQGIAPSREDIIRRAKESGLPLRF